MRARTVGLLATIAVMAGCHDFSVGVESDPERAVLSEVLRSMLETTDVQRPIPVHPKYIRVDTISRPVPGDKPEHYRPDAATALVDAVSSTEGFTLCEAQNGWCITSSTGDSSPVPDFLALSKVLLDGEDRATVWIYRFHTGTIEYYSAYYRASVSRSGGRWRVASLEWVGGEHSGCTPGDPLTREWVQSILDGDGAESIRQMLGLTHLRGETTVVLGSDPDDDAVCSKLGERVIGRRRPDPQSPTPVPGPISEVVYFRVGDRYLVYRASEQSIHDGVPMNEGGVSMLISYDLQFTEFTTVSWWPRRP